MGRIFNPENLFFRSLGDYVDIVGLSLLWALLCIPVITIGPATAALYHTAYMIFRKRSVGTYRRFFRSFVSNLKRGIPSTLIFVAIVAALYFLGAGYGIGAATQGTVGQVAFGFYYVVGIIIIGLACWVFPLLGRFEFTVGQLFSTAFQMAFAHLPTTILVVVLTFGAYIGVGKFYPLILILPSIWAVVVSFPMERAFARHMPAEETETVEDEEGASQQ